MSDTITLKVSKRKIYLAISLIVILAVCGVGTFLVFRYFTSPKLHIDSFSVESDPLVHWYDNESSWGTNYILKYKFSNQGGGAADSVKVVAAFYDSRGLVVNYTKEYGKVASNMEITDSNQILVNSYMHFTLPATFKIFLYDGNSIVDEATLPYG